MAIKHINGKCAKAAKFLIASLFIIVLTGCNQDKSASNKVISFELSQEHLLNAPVKKRVEKAISTPSLKGMQEIPFAMMRADDLTGKVAFDIQSNLSEIRFSDGHKIKFKMPGVPLSMQRLDTGKIIIAFRSIPENILWMVEWDAKEEHANYKKIERDGAEYLIFRKALAIKDTLFWVVFDSNTRKNYLRRYKYNSDGWSLAPSELELPLLEHPAGGTYEMEPPVFLFPLEGDSIRVVGGTLDLKVLDNEFNRKQINRVPNCEQILEAAATDSDVAMLCIRKAGYDKNAYFVYDAGRRKELSISNASGIPWKLSWNTETKQLNYKLAKDVKSYSQMMEFDFERGHNSGILEFGSNNVQGRVAWSQIYYLNGLFDAIYLARRDSHAFELIEPLLEKIRLRIEMEMRMLDSLLSGPSGFRTNNFTYDRSPALFAVQTSRALLLLNRYYKEFPGAEPLKNLDALAKSVPDLKQHIEVIADNGEESHWIKPGRKHLRWPRGSAFYFDGLAVPYNHQNEWAYSIFDANSKGALHQSQAIEPAKDIIRHFVDRLASDGAFPAKEKWYYWWGHAYDGYGPESGFSVNTPKYGGDKILAWISFRTIDLMSVLSALDFLPEIERKKLEASAVDRVREGDVYPFAARSLIEHKITPQFRHGVAVRYARAGAPWELSNQLWALTALMVAPATTQ